MTKSKMLEIAKPLVQRFDLVETGPGLSMLNAGIFFAGVGMGGFLCPLHWEFRYSRFMSPGKNEYMGKLFFPA